MRNPLYKRLPRELKDDLGKYIVIFLFMVLLISAISGFLVSDNSVADAYEKGFTKYNIEDGHLAFDQEISQELLDELEEKGNVTLYDLRYFEESILDEDNIRVYKDRDEVNLECVMSGRMPEKDNEIAIDRMYADNKGIKVGDTLVVNSKELTITGLIALVDYSCLFENNSDMMFDATSFSVGIMTDSGFESVNSKHLTYNYAWQYPVRLDREDTSDHKKYSDEFMDTLEDVLTDYDEALVDETIQGAKVLIVHEALEEIEKGLKAYGMSLDIYTSEDLLTMINDALKEEGIDLSEEIGEGEKEVTLNIEDIELALNASQEDLDWYQDRIDTIEDRVIEVTDYLPLYNNKAINFTGDDMGSDKASCMIMDYLITAIIAFIFAITTSNTITQEAGVIGTLRATGYTRKELLIHYMILPVGITLIAAVIGNILGYTYFKDLFVSVYYGNYSLCTYTTLYNSEALIDTTIIPIILMFVINFVVISSKLKLSPLAFLRRDLTKKKNKKALKLNSKIPFIHRFRLRILLQNIPNYITMFAGIFMAGVLLVFGLMFMPLLKDYADLVIDTRICDYQYVLVDEVETANKQAEKFAMTSLNTTDEDYMIDSISIYGIEENSQYIDQSIESGKVLISNSFAAKFGIKDGDTITLVDEFTSDPYDFIVQCDYTYDGGMCVFMNLDEFNDTFDEEDDHFNGYFSNEVIEDLKDEDIYTTITTKDLTKISTQMETSFGEFMSVFSVLGVLMFMMVMYILSKQIIEKNAQSISMTKILGFTNGEISSLYIIATSIAVIISLLLSIPLIKIALDWIFEKYLYTMMTGYVPNIIDPICYVKMVGLGVLSYMVVAIFLWFKINRIPKADALKNVE